MKNITLLLFLLAFNLNAQISGKLIPDGSIPTAKIIGGVGGGSISPLEFIVASVSDLTNGANANKIARLQTTITLTNNITLANGLTLYGDGGKYWDEINN